MKLSDHYLMIKSRAENQRVDLLLDYLIRHEKLRDEYLTNYEELAPPGILNYWVQCFPNKHSEMIEQCFDRIQNQQSYSLDDVVQMAIHFDNYLIEIYKALEKEASSDELKAVFHCMIQMAQQDEKDIVRDSQWLDDY
jgi:hypothetical protein